MPGSDRFYFFFPKKGVFLCSSRGWPAGAHSVEPATQRRPLGSCFTFPHGFVLSLTRSASQCVRKAPLKKPDAVLRGFHLQKVFEASKTVSKVLLLHPDPFRHKQARQRCFCNTKSNLQMVCCDTCDEWFHFKCVGLTAEEVGPDLNWDCGFCQAVPDNNGNRSWALPIPGADRKRKKATLVRNDANTPKARGIASNNDEEVVGPTTWEDFKALAREGGRKINEKEARYKRKAEQLVKEGGHHVVDAVGLGGVVARGVDATMVDDLV